MRLELVFTFCISLVGCAGSHEGLDFDEQDEDTQVDTDKFGDSDASEVDQDGSMDQASDASMDAPDRDVGGTPEDSGSQGTPQDIFVGTFEVTTTYTPTNTTCIPYPEKTIATIAKSGAYDYVVDAAKDTRFFVDGVWMFVDATTLDTGDQEVSFTETSFTYTVAYGYSRAQAGPGSSGFCGTTSHTVKGVRK